VAPPQFSNIGKQAKDLFSKKLDEKDFKYTVQTKNKTASGLVFTTGGDFDAKKDLTGSLKVNYKHSDYEGEASISTAGPAKAEFKLKKLAKGLTLIATADTHSKFIDGAKTTSLKVQAEYAQEFFAGSASAETAFWKPTYFGGSAVIGVDGLSVGAEVQLAADAKTEIKDYNLGAEYQTSDLTATLKTKKQATVLSATYFHKVNADVQVGGDVTFPIDGSTGPKAVRVGTLATEYKVDASTTVKVKGTTEKVASLAVEHRLPNPRVQIGVASSWDIVTFQAWNPKAFGFSFTFGDYDA